MFVFQNHSVHYFKVSQVSEVNDSKVLKCLSKCHRSVSQVSPKCLSAILHRFFYPFSPFFIVFEIYLIAFPVMTTYPNINKLFSVSSCEYFLKP